MSKTLRLQISDSAYARLTQQAAAKGMAVSRYAVYRLEGEQEVVDARRSVVRAEDFFGAVDLGRATGLDNEAIDRDLFRYDPHGVPEGE